jgi:hypothetical protein
MGRPVPWLEKAAPMVVRARNAMFVAAGVDFVTIRLTSSRHRA